MLGAIYIGLSGMNAYSSGLRAISNNVANLNSPGYKATAVDFSDVFDSGGGGARLTRGIDENQSGNGVRFGEPQIDFSQGDLRQSDGDLDLAIQGSGFLVLLNGDTTAYARTGQFTVATDGYITLQGTDYRLAALDDAGRVSTVNIEPKRTSPPAATTTITFADNLSSAGTTASVSDIAVYDAQGARQTWQVKFDAVAGSNPRQWTVTVLDQAGATVATSALRFIGATVDPGTEKLTIVDDRNTADAGDDLSVVLDFSGAVTSFSSGSSSTLRAASVDGRGAGALTSVTVDDEGRIELAYSNEQTETLGAIALADFRDPQRLERIGDGLFEDRGGGVRDRLLPSAVDGMGRLVSRQIEASNVDLSQEFGDLILIQRGFQASSQVVSVTNEMIQQLFGIRGQG